MNEFFDPPPNGPLRLSRSYLERSGRATERASRAPYGFTSFGTSGETTAGPYQYVDQQGVVFAVITAQPTTSGSDEFTGYSWMQRRPRPDGGWDVPVPMLRGDNGSEGTPFFGAVTNVSRTDNVVQLSLSAPSGLTVGETVTVSGMAGAGSTLNGTFVVTAASGVNLSYYRPGADIAFAAESGTVSSSARPRSNPAFDPNGDEAIAVGTVVGLVRGYLHTSTQNASNRSLAVAGDPGSGVLPDAEQNIGQEWLILGAGGGTGSVRVRVTGRPFVQDGKRYYPAVLDLNDAAGVGYHDGPDPLWVVQRHGQYLDTRGLSTYTARRKLASFNVPDCDGNDDERPLYDTREHIVVVRVDFDPVCQAYYDGVYEGKAVCDRLTIDGDLVTIDGDYVGVG